MRKFLVSTIAGAVLAAGAVLGVAVPSAGAADDTGTQTTTTQTTQTQTTTTQDPSTQSSTPTRVSGTNPRAARDWWF